MGNPIFFSEIEPHLNTVPSAFLNPAPLNLKVPVLIKMVLLVVDKQCWYSLSLMTNIINGKTVISSSVLETFFGS